ncbi:MAG: hypothetical protein R3282_03635 [Rhodothermales bacterium]|nr:hypothetical protein [Rhodothermales bacterium]
MNPDEHLPGTARTVLVRTLQLMWLPIAVFVAFELTVPDEISILRSVTPGDGPETVLTTDDLIAAPVPPLAQDARESGSLHAYFGIEEIPTTDVGEPAAEDDAAGITALGSWSGRFAGVLAGDEDAGCWSAYDFDIVLNETPSGVSGSGSYWVEPASCSLHETRFVAFVEAAGTRSGSSVDIELVASGDERPVLTFNGLLMRDRMSGWFYLPNGTPVSGPVVLGRK